jgi:hypothetical protein
MQFSAARMLKLVSEAFDVSHTGTATAGRRLWNAAVYFLALVGLIVLLIVFTPFVGWYAGQFLRPWGSDRGDILIVLSAAGPNRPDLGPAVMDGSNLLEMFHGVAVLPGTSVPAGCGERRKSGGGHEGFLCF